jgi:uncharacterized protein with GYD domain
MAQSRKETPFMKFVMLAKVTPYGAQNREERGRRALENATRLDLKIECLYYTGGPYDLVEILEGPNWEAAYAQAMWFKKQGYGEMNVMPCVDGETNARIDAENV